MKAYRYWIADNEHNCIVIAVDGDHLVAWRAERDGHGNTTYLSERPEGRGLTPDALFRNLAAHGQQGEGR